MTGRKRRRTNVVVLDDTDEFHPLAYKEMGETVVFEKTLRESKFSGRWKKIKVWV